MPLLEVKDVSKQYDQTKSVLTDINFQVEAGEFISIIGPSGAGKSTLLRCINRMIEANSGSIIFDGVNVTSLKKESYGTYESKLE